MTLSEQIASCTLMFGSMRFANRMPKKRLICLAGHANHHIVALSAKWSCKYSTKCVRFGKNYL
jgi:hypothetical protein